MSVTILDNGRLELELIEDPGVEGMRLTIVGHVESADDTAEGARAILAFLDEHARCVSEIRSVVQRAMTKLTTRSDVR
jgi:hypothetical protein